jgi:hypothetical protein
LKVALARVKLLLDQNSPLQIFLDFLFKLQTRCNALAVEAKVSLKQYQHSIHAHRHWSELLWTSVYSERAVTYVHSYGILIDGDEIRQQ